MVQNAGTDGKADGRNLLKTRFSFLSDRFSRMKQIALSCWIPKPECLTNLRKKDYRATRAAVASNEIETNSEEFGNHYRYLRTEFTYAELRNATNNFGEANFVGKGDNSTVYKGTLSDGKKIALKIYERSMDQRLEKAFFDEVENIGRLHHPNLVTFVGYCITRTKKIFVYEWVNNKSLQFHLHGEGRQHMDWPTRRKIAIGCAKGLEYLHNYCTPRIIHKNIRPSNILLDDNFDAKIADFGFKDDLNGSASATDCYIDPEYQSTSMATFQSDAYSFGVVLLELITGRPIVDKRRYHISTPNIVIWAKKALAALPYWRFIDEALAHNYDRREMDDMFKCAITCVFNDVENRPSLSTVTRILEGPILALSSLELVITSHFSINSKVQILASRLVNANPDERRGILRKNLYPLVKKIIPYNLNDKIASEIMEVLVRLDEIQILKLIEFPRILKMCVDKKMDDFKFKFCFEYFRQ